MWIILIVCRNLYDVETIEESKSKKIRSVKLERIENEWLI